MALGAFAATSLLLNSEADTGAPFALFTSALMASPLLPRHSTQRPSVAQPKPAPQPSFPEHRRPWDSPAAPSRLSCEYPFSAAQRPFAWQSPLPPLYKIPFPESPSRPAIAPAACLPVQYDRHRFPESPR